MLQPVFNTTQSGININANSIKLIGTTGSGIIHNDASGNLFSALIQGSDIGYQTITSDNLNPSVFGTGSLGTTGATGIQGIQGPQGAVGPAGSSSGSTGIIVTDNNSTTTSYLVFTTADGLTGRTLYADAPSLSPLSYVPSTGVLTVGALNVVGSTGTTTSNIATSLNFTGTTGTTRTLTNVSAITFLDQLGSTANTSMTQTNKGLIIAPMSGVTGCYTQINATNSVGEQVNPLTIQSLGTKCQTLMKDNISLVDSTYNTAVNQSVTASTGIWDITNNLGGGLSASTSNWSETSSTNVKTNVFSSTATGINFNVPVNIGSNNLKCSFSPVASNDVVNKLYCDNKVAALVASAPATLDTLNELSVALGNDPNYATTTATLIGTKASLTATQTISGINTLSNASNLYYGSGANLTNVNATLISPITMPSTGTFYSTWTNSDVSASNLTPYTSTSIKLLQATNTLSVPNLTCSGDINCGSNINSTTGGLHIKIGGVTRLTFSSYLDENSQSYINYMNCSTSFTANGNLTCTGNLYCQTGNFLSKLINNSGSINNGGSIYNTGNINTTSISLGGYTLTPGSNTSSISIWNTYLILTNYSTSGITHFNVYNASNEVKTALSISSSSVKVGSNLVLNTGVGITASDVQTITFGTNAPTMGGANIGAGTIPVASVVGTAVNLNSAQTISEVKTFSALPESNVAPTTANQLCNKTYVDGQISSSLISIGSYITGATTLTEANLKGFYAYNSGSGYTITLPNPSAVLAGRQVYFKGIGLLSSDVYLTTTSGSYMFEIGYATASQYINLVVAITDPKAKADDPKSYVGSADSNKNCSSYICDGSYWHQVSKFV